MSTYVDPVLNIFWEQSIEVIVLYFSVQNKTVDKFYELNIWMVQILLKKKVKYMSNVSI